MSVQEITEDVFNRLENRGYRGQITSVEHVRELKDEIEGRYERGELPEEFYREWIATYKYGPPDELPGAKSIIIVAVPQGSVRFTFHVDDTPLPLTIAPTFIGKDEIIEEVKSIIAETLGREGYQIAWAALPKKLLAVRSGLGEYGRNNVCYVPGMGSYNFLIAFYSDMPCLQDHWRDAVAMESCNDCTVCLKRCPSGAIMPERFLYNVERCINYQKEKPGDLPDWVEPSWHDCLVGCLHCQKVCPQNVKFKDRIEKEVEFSNNETELLLKGAPIEQLPEDTVKKLEKLDIIDYLEFICRDLSIFVERMH